MSDIQTPDDDIVVAKSQAPQPESDQSHPKGRIHGWLGFFLWLYIAAGGVATALGGILEFSVSGSELEGLGWGYIACGVLFLLMIAALAIYTVHAFIKRKPDAVFLAKLYTVVMFFMGLLIAYGGADDGQGGMVDGLKVGLWSVIAFLYFTFAKQVKEVIPKSTRRVLRRDYYILGAFVAVPLIAVVTSFAQGVAEAINEPDPISQTSLSVNEYTDGRIAFTKPEGMQIEQEYEEDGGGVYYSLSSDEVYMQIVSAIDPDASQENYDSYWAIWKEANEIEEGTYTITAEGRSTLNGNPCFYRTIRIGTDPSVSWSFYVLFNEETGIACVVNVVYEGDALAYDTRALLRSIRFGS